MVKPWFSTVMDAWAECFELLVEACMLRLDTRESCKIPSTLMSR
jgi:hypothetical protein